MDSEYGSQGMYSFRNSKMSKLTFKEKIALEVLASVHNNYNKNETKWRTIFRKNTVDLFKVWANKQLKPKKVAELTQEWAELSRKQAYPEKEK